MFQETNLLMMHDQMWMLGWDLGHNDGEQAKRWLSYYPDVIPF